MRWFHRGMTQFIIVFLLAAVILSVPAYFIYTNARGLVTGQVGKNAIDIAESVAVFVEKDIDNFLDTPVYVYGQDAESTESAESGTIPETPDSPDESAESQTDSYTDSSDDDESFDDTADSGYWYDDGWYYDSSGEDDWYDDEELDGDAMYDDAADDIWPDDDAAYDDAYDGTSWYDGEYDGFRSSTPMLSGGLSPDADTTAPASAKPAFNDEYLNEITLLLDEISSKTGAAQIYITKRVSDTRKGFVMNPDNTDTDALSSELTQEELLAFNNGVKLLSSVLSDNDQGEYLQGYAPIFDAVSGNAVGVVVVKFWLSDAVGLMSGVSLIIVASFVLILVLTTLVVNRLLSSRAKYLYTDYLTGLYNKRCFEKRMASSVYRARPSKRLLSLVMIDIDRFKCINDTLGHAAGDEVLKGVAAMLRRCTRRNDCCCRFGGDEFALILPRTTGAQAAAIAERIRTEASRLVFSAAGQTFGVTLSIGVAETGGSATADELLALADKSMYNSKNSGKNRTTVCGWA